MMSQTAVDQDAARAAIRSHGLIAILRGDFSRDRVMQMAQALHESGIRVLEVTLNSSGALHLIESLRNTFSDGSMLIGAGTVRSEGQLRDAVRAGAGFTVAPNLDEQSVRTAVALGFLHVPGVLTPTEAVRAVATGSQVVKLFPVDQFGPSYLKALRAPLNDIDFIPTGGVDAGNVAHFVKAGAFAVGIGSALISGPTQPLDDIRHRARALVEAWEAAQDA